jgi:hypothetical protein
MPKPVSCFMNGDNWGSLFLGIPEIVRRESILFCLGGMPVDYWGNENF